MNTPTRGTMTVGAAAALLVNEYLKRVGMAPLDLDSLAALAIVLTYVGHTVQSLFHKNTPQAPS